ncbi:MAG: glycoside hydrolase family 13 protein [Chitinophagales bacterium]|nr:glycoside hydrolase family 13 protein [Chitinophagales bacterium]
MKFMRLLSILLCTNLFLGIGFAQGQIIKHITPPNWWTGMNDPAVQLMIHGDNIAAYDVKINYPGVEVFAVSKVENPNYIFVDLKIGSSVKPGTMNLEFSNGTSVFTQPYVLNQREKRTMAYGLNSQDFIYLIMPDRFSNGDTTNDVASDMNEKYYGRTSLTARHGGDIQGIINHLDYIKNLGVTAVWCTPLLENNQEEWSYHGYAATDHYKVDKRFGSNELYKKYAMESHKRNVKVVMDIVPNHCGSQHWMIKDLPMKDWVHQWDTYTKTNYRTPALLDQYGSEYDKKLMLDGWFDKHMPDLNQQNPYVAKYLIQNYIWWVEYAQVDGFRIDTYTYNDLKFMQDAATAIFNEYPGLGMFAETWVDGVGVQGYFNGNNNLNTGYNSLLPGVTDFELLWSINNMVQKPFGWSEGLGSIYLKLTQDYLYGDANKNVVFLGNHDLSRFFSVAGEDVNKMKLATTFILTTRGIPQWYYGDEILMKNFTNPDGRVREDFPGGWQGDSINKFKPENLKGDEKDYFNYVKTLATYRKTSIPITQGKLMQFVPYDGVYVYFRYTDTQCVMVVMNTTDKPVDLSTKNYAERMSGFTKAKNIMTKVELTNLNIIAIPAMSAQVLELR